MNEQQPKQQQEVVASTAAGNVVQAKTQAFEDNRPQTVAQRKLWNGGEAPVQKKANSTGLPDQLKSGIENLSGHSMDDVKVHYNSSQPAQLQAHAYAQGTNIHLAPGQEKHLPHEAWHVVQQKQGRVKPTMQLKSKVNVNDDVSLEKEADVMGAKAVQRQANTSVQPLRQSSANGPVQREVISVPEHDLTIPQQTRMTKAVDQFKATVLAGSPLAQGNTHVVFHGVRGHVMNSFAGTTIYFGKNGYKGDDVGQFKNLWEMAIDDQIPHDTGLRIVIALNMDLNSTIHALYATMLHEWYVHAVKWEGFVHYVRQGEGRFAAAWITGQGHVRREAGEHKAFATTTDEKIQQYVHSLGLQQKDGAIVYGLLKKDRDRHDPHTGNAN